MKVLFVGGTKDGEVFNLTPYKMREPRKVRIPVIEYTGMKGAIFRDEVYCLEAIIVRGREAWVAVHEGLELTDKLAFRVEELLEQNNVL